MVLPLSCDPQKINGILDPSTTISRIPSQKFVGINLTSHKQVSTKSWKNYSGKLEQLPSKTETSPEIIKTSKT